MRIRCFALFLLSALCTCVGFAQEAKADRDRVKVAARASEAIQLVAERSGSPVATEYARVFREGAAVAGPKLGEKPGALRVIGLPFKEKDRFYLPVIFRSDYASFPFWEEAVNERFPAATSRMGIVLFGDTFSDCSLVYLGLCCQHEMFHWLGKSGDEVAAYSYEFGLLHLIGGREYAKLLSQEVARIRRSFIRGEQGDLGYPAAAEYSVYETGLARVFGKAHSELEKLGEVSDLWLDALFTYLDAYQPAHAQEDKLTIITELYKKK